MKNNIEFTVGMTVVIPEPKEDDTWYRPMTSFIEDILDDGTIIFLDDEFDSHEIEITRISLYQPSIHNNV